MKGNEYLLKQIKGIFKMYITSYKTNNSYTTYVIHDSREDKKDKDYYIKPKPKSEWKQGRKVFHNVYGIGTICEITSDLVKVHFEKTKMINKLKKVQVAFEYKINPSEVESLKLC